MIIGRNEPLDYKSVFETIVNTLADYLTKNNIKTMVIGLSGGIDSSVSASICRVVSDKTGVKLIGVSLPCSTNKDDEKSSASFAGKEFCDKFVENNIEDVFAVIERSCRGISDMESTNISQGNIKARLRMIILYDIASKTNGVVIDNDQLSEHMIGFWTINGDCFDISPLGNLWKTEVYELAKYIKENVFKNSKALESAINIVPTDGNGVSGSDLDQIMPGYTYDDVDSILMPWSTLNESIKEQYINNGYDFERGTIFFKLCEKYGKENVVKVIKRSVNSEFKRYPHPIPIDIFRGQIVKKLTFE